jgi:Fe-Mn family superoxide dismutase
MTSVPQPIGKRAPAGTPRDQLMARKFDFSRVRGLSEPALELHRSLYETYVKETNALLEQLYAPPPGQDPSTAEQLQRDGLVRRYAFERNGMVLHELFFETLGGPGAPPSASGVFMEAADTSFGGFDIWKRDVARLARTRGVGWVLTFQSPDDNRLFNVWVDDHARGLIAGLRPIVALDFWEHAYLFDFKPSERSKYVETLFGNLNWDVVEARCRTSSQVAALDAI